MKTKSKNQAQIKDFDTIKVFREIKDKMSLEMSKMNFEEIKEYLKKNSAKLYDK